MELTKKESREREKHARMWLRLRQDNLLSQVLLADILGISRRTVQAIEGGECIPRFSTQRAFKNHKEKLDRERDRDRRREHGWAA